MTGVWVTGDLITAARLNEKGILSDTNANILVATLYSGMMVFPTDTSTLNANQPYIRNNANTAWIGIATLGANTFTATQTINSLVLGGQMNANAQTISGGFTSTGVITMSGANISLGANSIVTSSFTLKEVSTLPSIGVALLLQPTSGNANMHTGLAPSGIANANFFSVFRTSDTTINYQLMSIGSDQVVGGEFAIRSWKGGIATQLPINIYQSATKLLSFDIANTLTSYVDFLQTTGKKIGLNVGLTSYLIETSAGQIDIFTNLNQGLRVVQGATTTTENNVVIGKISALATTTTDGFLYMPSGAGPPTGVPTAFIGKIPLYYDSTNNFLYIYNGGWKKSTVFA